MPKFTACLLDPAAATIRPVMVPELAALQPLAPGELAGGNRHSHPDRQVGTGFGQASFDCDSGGGEPKVLAQGEPQARSP